MRASILQTLEGRLLDRRPARGWRQTGSATIAPPWVLASERREGSTSGSAGTPRGRERAADAPEERAGHSLPGASRRSVVVRPWRAQSPLAVLTTTLFAFGSLAVGVLFLLQADADLVGLLVSMLFAAPGVLLLIRVFASKLVVDDTGVEVSTSSSGGACRGRR